VGKAKRAWNWIRAHTGELLAGAVAVIAFLVWRSLRGDEATSLKGALAVARAERDIAKLTERRDAAVARADAKEPEIQAIDAKLVETRRAIVEGRAGAAKLTDDEILAEYKRMGYLR
jgi:hypothetical protein